MPELRSSCRLAPGALGVLGLADGFSVPGFPLGNGCDVNLAGNLFLLVAGADATGTIVFPIPLPAIYIPNVQLNAQMVVLGAGPWNIHAAMGWTLWESP